MVLWLYNRPIIPAPDDKGLWHMSIEYWWNDNWQIEAEILGGKHAPVPLCPLPTPHGLPWK